MTSRLTLLLFVPAIAAAAPARRSKGSVTYATPRRAYLDRGQADGLAQGAVLRMARGGRDLYDCRILWTSAHSAVCEGDGARVGDTFTIAAPAVVAAAQEKKPLPVPPEVSAAEVQEGLDTLASAPQPVVEYHAPPEMRWRRSWSAEAALGHQAWVAFGGAEGTFQAERVDLSLRGLPVAGPFDLFVEATLLQFTDRPDDPRFRPDTRTQAYLWEAEMSARPIGRPWTLSVGRIWPYNAPGLTILDGAQGGWRSQEGTAEVGVFGGGLPDADRIVPANGAFTAGGYWALDRMARGRLLPQLQHEGRVGVVDSKQMDPRVQVDLGVVAAVLDGLDLGVAGRMGVDADGTDRELEMGSVDLSARLRDDVSLTGGFRHLSVQGAPVNGDAFSGYGDGSDRGDLGATWDALRWLSVGASGGAATGGDPTRTRGWGGPELGFPTLFGRIGGLRIGHQEEAGWLPGRSTFAQAVLLPLERLQLLLRLTYAEERHDDDAGRTFVTREGGLYSRVRLRILDWLDFSATALGRTGIVSDGSTPPMGVVVLGQLSGHLER